LLNLVKSNRMEVLMEALAELVAQGPDDPFTPEWIGIQSRGMKQWISLRLAEIMGISAHIRFLFPREIIQLFLDRNQDMQETLAVDEDTLIWSVMAQLENAAETPLFNDLNAYFTDDDTGKKQVQLSSRIACVLDDYQVYRPKMLMAWEQHAGPQYPGNPVEKWQAVLWRSIVEKRENLSLPKQMDALLDAAANKKLAGLPNRICLFGLSMVPPSFTALFSALDTEVFLFLLTPSNQFFFDIASPRHMERLALETHAEQRRDPADSHYEITNPLLASLGRSGSQFHAGLEALPYLEPFGDLFMDPVRDEAPACMLHQLQSDILHLVNRCRGGGHAPVPVAENDGSICVHACHSPMREAQVLKDLLLDAFVGDPHLAPHEVVVMMPDIEAYAPYIEAVFSLEHPLPYSISDRRHATESSTIGAFLKILDMKGSRLEQSRVLDLLLCPAIAEKFSISHTDIQNLEQMVRQAGILWGKDKDHRRAVAGKGFLENTWEFGLQRLFMGYAMPRTFEDLVGGVLPCPCFEGLEADILGRFAHFCHTLFYHLGELAGKKSPTQWEPVFTGLVSGMMASDESSQADIRYIIQTCERLSYDADKGGYTGELSFEAIQDMLISRLDKTIAQGSFLAGGITFCNLMPMRSIPFKVVALMGMDEASFPRKVFVPGFDLISAFPGAGDKNIRDEDRHLFLETLLSARHRLIITYTGMGIKDNAPIPCSGVISELADVMEQSFVFASGYRWWFTHPLHGFSQAYFDRSLDFFSYSQHQCAIARSMYGPAVGDSRVQEDQHFQEQTLESRFSQDQAAPIFLAALHRFFRNPLELFCTISLVLEFPMVEEPLPDREPFQVSGLDRYHLGTWLLEKESDAAMDAAQAWYPLVRAGGHLPLGNQGRLQWQSVCETTLPVKVLAQQHMPEIRLDPVTIDIVLGNTRIFGPVSDLFAEDGGIIRCVAGVGRINARRLLINWITHLALTLAKQDIPVETRIIGRDPKDRQPGVVRKLLPVGAQAKPILSDLVSVYEKGLGQVWAFFPDTCFVLAKIFFENDYQVTNQILGQALKAAGPVWFNAYSKSGEKTDRYAAAWLAGRPDPFDSPDELLASGLVENALLVYRPLMEHMEPNP
jgi:exodeoxyribonuclease V gamma subunit